MNDVAARSVDAATIGANGPPALAATVRPAAASRVVYRGGPVEAVHTALRRATTVRAGSSGGRWQAILPATRRRAYVDLDRDWLTFAVPLPRRRGPMDLARIGALLRRNARMPGWLRIVGWRLEPDRHLVCEIPTDALPLDCDAAVDRLIAAVVEDLRANLGKRRDTLDRPAPSPPTAEVIIAMLEEAGWPVRRGDGERVEVPLDVEGEYVVASIDATDGPSRLVMPVLEQELRSATRNGRRALTALTWLVASGVRMVKARRERRALSLEACLPPVPVSTTGLAHGCAALSLAARRMLAESRLLLADERLARTYLARLGLADSQ